LTTIGYGDYHPETTKERVLCTFVFIFGVVVFSFLMGNFIEILMEYKHVTADNEDSGELTKFMGLLARFNKGRPLSKEMTKKIENYFEFYWKHDRNYAIKSDEDMRIMSELPKSVRIKVSFVVFNKSIDLY
jgi:hypothetical protein